MLENVDGSPSYPLSAQISNVSAKNISDFYLTTIGLEQKEVDLVRQSLQLSGDRQDEDIRTALFRSGEGKKHQHSLDARSCEDKNVQLK